MNTCITVQDLERKGEAALFPKASTLSSTACTTTVTPVQGTPVPHSAVPLPQSLRRQVTRPRGPQTRLLVWPGHPPRPKLSSHWWVGRAWMNVAGAARRGTGRRGGQSSSAGWGPGCAQPPPACGAWRRFSPASAALPPSSPRVCSWRPLCHLPGSGLLESSVSSAGPTP